MTWFKRLAIVMAMAGTSVSPAGTLESLEIRRDDQLFHFRFVARIDQPLGVMREIIDRFELLPLISPMIESVWTEDRQDDDPLPTLHMMVRPCVLFICWSLRKSSRVTRIESGLRLRGTGQGSYRRADEQLWLIAADEQVTELHYRGALQLKERVPDWITAGMTRFVARRQIERGLPKMETLIDHYRAGTLEWPSDSQAESTQPTWRGLPLGSEQGALETLPDERLDR
ncbi:hypothetical protein OAS86_05825 [Gammaproteobacteria bacterium]|nr:hypothetical protein [Gammaproteobacteria bacterium]